jgi:hypothetical protein
VGLILFVSVLQYKDRILLKNNIKVCANEIGCQGMDWIDLAQDGDNC